MDFRDVIDLWPTQRAFAKDIGVTPQAVTDMLELNSINLKHWQRMEDAAKDRGIRGVTYKILHRIDYEVRRKKALENDKSDSRTPSV